MTDQLSNIEQFGYVPDHMHPDNTVAATYDDALVVCWDLKNSTQKIIAKGATLDRFWEAQSIVLLIMSGSLRSIPPDVVTPTGDGFLMVFNLQRFIDPKNPGLKNTLRSALPIVSGILWYQDHRAEARPLTDGNGVTRLNDYVTIVGSTMMDGRIGMARGMVAIHDCPSVRTGHWIAPVGMPIYIASRLCSMAPDGGLLIETSVLPDGFTGDVKVPERLQATHENVEPKGYPDPVTVWRLAPKAEEC